MGKDWLVLDVISDDRRRAFKYFVADFVNFFLLSASFSVAHALLHGVMSGPP